MEKHLHDVHIQHTATGLTIASGRLQRHWELGTHGALTRSLTLSGRDLSLADVPEDPDRGGECLYDGLLRLPRRRGGMFPPLRFCQMEVMPVSGGSQGAEHLVVHAEWEEPLQGLRLGRRWRVLPHTDAVVSEVSIRSESVPQAMDCWSDSQENVIDTLPLQLQGWQATAVLFYGRTDLHNEPVQEERFAVPGPGEPSRTVSGNLLILESPSGDGLFLLHESAPENERRPEVAGTFRIDSQGVMVLGWGVSPLEICSGRDRWSYPVALGAYAAGDALVALRRYLKQRFPVHPLDLAVVANPWGDGHCYEKFSEAFVLAEIAGTARMGATHYQIDDGWQAGGVLADLTCSNLARSREYWAVHPEKFPRGFTPLVEAAREHGVELALWFCPDVARGYRNWEEDRDILLQMHQQYGINLVKLDGVRLYSKDAEEGLLALLEGVIQGSDGRMRFNMDVTNGLRLGYFTSMRFGTLFVENRYVTGRQSAVRTYYPWRVLRNLWRLCRYLPPERLQFEFANLQEAVANQAMSWDRESLLTPFNCSWEYIAAVPMMAAPLCWLEPSSLPADVQARVEGVLRLHRQIAPSLAKGFTFPVGAEPNGHTWTGFDCVDSQSPGCGHLVLYREDSEHARMEMRFARPRAGMRSVRLTCLSHPDSDVVLALSPDGSARFQIPERNAFRLYRYEMQEAEAT